MKNLIDMHGQRYELPDEIAAAALQAPASALLFDDEGKIYKMASHDLSQYSVAGAGHRLAVLNPVARVVAGDSGAQPRLCGPIVTWCSGGFCLD